MTTRQSLMLALAEGRDLFDRIQRLVWTQDYDLAVEAIEATQELLRAAKGLAIQMRDPALPDAPEPPGRPPRGIPDVDETDEKL